MADAWYSDNADNYGTAEEAFEATAVWFLKNNDAWQTWLPDDEKEKVLAKLNE